MTEARMDWRKMELTLDGHANYDEPGKDIVCAAISILSQALVNTLQDIEMKYGMAKPGWKAEEKGHMAISAQVCWANLSMIRGCFEVTVTGLRMLADRYPEYIRLEEV